MHPVRHSFLLALVACLLAVPPLVAQRLERPIPDEVLEANRQLVEGGAKRSVLVETGARIDGVALEKGASVALARATGQLIVLSDVRAPSPTLAYYDADGRRRWARVVDLSNGWYDREHLILWAEISEDGERIVVYASQHLETVIAALYDVEGELLASFQPFAHMAPSGRYFFGTDEMYGESFFHFLDAELRPIDTGLDRLLEIDPARFDYGMQYRVLEDDLLVGVFYEFEGTTPGTTPGTTGPPDRDDPSRTRRAQLFAFDLVRERLLVQLDLSIPDARFSYDRSFTANLSDQGIDVRGGRMVLALHTFTQGAELACIDLQTGRVRRRRLSTYNTLTLALDGRSYVIGRNEGGQRVLRGHDWESDRQLFEVGGALHEHLVDAVLRERELLAYMGKFGEVPHLARLPLGGDRPEAVAHGWFDRDLRRGFVPVRSGDAGEGIRLLVVRRDP